MAAMGLLQGFGRGLSQSSELLARGMAEDREAERQRLREASAEARWKRQEQREDSRYADEKKYREDRNKVEESRYTEQKKAQAEAAKQAQSNWQKSYGLQERELNETTALRKTTQIESNIAGIEAAQEKSEAKITDKYARLMSREGITKEEFTELNQQFTDEVKQNRDYYSGKLHQFRQSYGDKLKGTGYEYLLHVKPDATADDTAGAADPATTQAVVNDLTGGGGSTRTAAINNILTQPVEAKLSETGVQPTYALDANGMPELSAGNLLKKWGQNMQPTPISEQSKQFTNALQQNNITSAYGAASMAQQPGLLSHTFQRKF